MVRRKLITLTAVAVMTACAAERDPVPIDDSQTRLERDRTREQLADDILGSAAPGVSRDEDVDRMIAALEPRASVRDHPFRKQRPAPLPDVGLHGGMAISLQDAVALVAHTIGYEVAFTGESDPGYPVEGLYNHQPAHRILDDVAYQSNHYISVFPQSRMILVMSEQRDRDPEGQPVRSTSWGADAARYDPTAGPAGADAVILEQGIEPDDDDRQGPVGLDRLGDILPDADEPPPPLNRPEADMTPSDFPPAFDEVIDFGPALDAGVAETVPPTIDLPGASDDDGPPSVEVMPRDEAERLLAPLK